MYKTAYPAKVYLSGFGSADCRITVTLDVFSPFWDVKTAIGALTEKLGFQGIVTSYFVIRFHMPSLA
jgi:hypothetical protein